jgi:Protein of unknown function (DUF1553)
LPNNGPLARRLLTEAAISKHRSVYLPLLRGVTPRSLEVFDFAEQGMVTGSRDTTTVATQALYLLNDPFVRCQALYLAGRLLHRTELNADGRVDLAYRLTLGRTATLVEVDRARDYLAHHKSTLVELLALKPEPNGTKPGDISNSNAPATDQKNSAPVSTEAVVPRRPAPPVNPDEVMSGEEPVAEEVVRAPDAETAAWASFCQALLASAEFRYVR